MDILESALLIGPQTALQRKFWLDSLAKETREVDVYWKGSKNAAYCY
jgi:hypothetical protein